MYLEDLDRGLTLAVWPYRFSPQSDTFKSEFAECCAIRPSCSIGTSPSKGHPNAVAITLGLEYSTQLRFVDFLKPRKDSSTERLTFFLL
ncbi:MAG: hypothetical protein CM1200mP18_20990 [Gammaproteobacteria bacterium]|nr:MAG: hypothetical protein CM1200mP18_20990 [Gammaproteobacteria bacterium]